MLLSVSDFRKMPSFIVLAVISIDFLSLQCRNIPVHMYDCMFA